MISDICLRVLWDMLVYSFSILVSYFLVLMPPLPLTPFVTGSLSVAKWVYYYYLVHRTINVQEFYYSLPGGRSTAL